ncbi:hypothetical protein WAI453_004871 [Rhynchosporium graminicola]
MTATKNIDRDTHLSSMFCRIEFRGFSFPSFFAKHSREIVDTFFRSASLFLVFLHGLGELAFLHRETHLLHDSHPQCDGHGYGYLLFGAAAVLCFPP